MTHAHTPKGKAARKLLATTFAESPWGMALITLDGCFLEADAAYCRRVGYTLEELRALDLVAITHADDRAEGRRRLQAALARDPGAFTWEKRYIRKAGQIVSVRGSVSIFRGEHHEPVYLVGIFEDLSARNTAIGQAEGMFWRCREDLMGRVLWEEFPPILGTEFEGHYPPRDTWLHASAYPAKDGLTIYLRDVTERKRAQQVLLESKEHFRLLHDLADTTRTLADPAQIMAATTRLLGEHLRASRCAYADVAGDGEHFTILHDYTDGCASIVGSFLLSLFGARARTTLLNGQPLVVRDVDAELQPGDGAAMFNAIGIKAVICCSLIKGDGLRALMAVHQTTPRDWTLHEVATVQEVLERCWAAIERRNAEEKLRASEGLLRIAGRAAHLGGWAVDLQDMRVHQRAAWVAWQQAMATSGNYSIEGRLRRADGAYRWWLVRGVPMRDAAGKVVK